MFKDCQSKRKTMNIFYKQRNFPVFQNRVYDSKRETVDCIRGATELVQDPITGLIHNAAFDPALAVYDENYQNEQGVSSVFQAHLLQVAEVVRRRLGDRDLVEVGCDKGRFRDPLLRQGCDATGFDPAYEGKNPRIEWRFFDHRRGIIANGIILRHVLEHIRDPVVFLQELRTSNNSAGLIYIEVPDFDWICQHRAWFDIYDEHVNYFRLNDLLAMFNSVVDAGRLFGNQYLYIVAELGSLRRPTFREGDELSFPEDFLSTLNATSPSREIPGAVWGGSSKGVIFSPAAQPNGLSPVFRCRHKPAETGALFAGHRHPRSFSRGMLEGTSRGV